ncbi:hypothetical protein [Rhizobium sp. Leaf383]|uniref:hypothetical protein n=1 Tax=Rhizobium sp. Leaf383 TaxID=1736357 RepID=UPI0007893575|nr:hypothetical protein [Rhizobium sp. Leaf383]
MMTTVTIPHDLATAIIDVVNELASELDLHYEDDDLVACAPTIEKMERLVAMLRQAGYECPETYQHIVERYHLSLN